MALTRAQLLQGNSALGIVLPGTAQGVTAGAGITISPSGAISVNIVDPVFNSLVRTNSPVAFNGYVWPSSPGTVGQQLTLGLSNTLRWADADSIPWTQKGELIVGTGVGIDTLLSPGRNTSALVADSDSPAGLAYTDSITSAILVPSGTTAERPSSPVPGQIRLNTDSEEFEFYNGDNVWEEFVGQSIPDVGTPSAVIPTGVSSNRQTVPPPQNGYMRFNTETQQLEVFGSLGWGPVGGSPSEFLVGSYTLYVNPEIGEDTYVTGVYDSSTTPAITNQQITCGYTPQKPFKTIARAALEVARITGPGTGFDPDFYDRIVIKVSNGDFQINNAAGGTVTPWTDGFTPTDADLAAFNPSGGGIILPRGVSVIGEDLRKSVIRPTFVPPATGNQNTGRTAIFRVTGGSFFFNFTFKDKLGATTSHHLVDCFQFISESDLQAYYNKVQVALGFATPETPANPGETEIVAPQPPAPPTAATDGVTGSSPYIFNCSIRSLYGLCGIHADGAVPTGFKSMVVAQFTGVSLQKDLSCWQRYLTGSNTWGSFTTYSQYISESPNNVRMNPDRLSAHIRTRNGAVVQAVSVFAIGQGVHHWAESGSEVTITNSNSNFGGVAALADGYRPSSFSTDVDWVTEFIRVPTNLTDNTNNINRIYLGTIQSVSATGITLTVPLTESLLKPGQPSVVGSRGYTLAPNSLVWVENFTGEDWYSYFSTPGWSVGTPSELNITAPLVNQTGASPGIGPTSLAIGKRVYIRRLFDSRTFSQRQYSLVLTNSSGVSRNPALDYVIQTQLGSPGIIANFGPQQTMGVLSSTPLDPSPYGSTAATEIILSRRDSPQLWVANTFYRSGDVVIYQNKHWLCRIQNQSAIFDPFQWDETYVHTADNYAAPDSPNNTAPVIIFDNDTDPNVASTTLGYNLTTVWSTNPEIYDQYRSSTDFKGAQLFLTSIGFTPAQANIILTPTPNASRDLNPATPLYGLSNPSGASNVWSNWAVQFRRPTNIRMFGHAWEWSGYLNYTKALPPYQKDLSDSNRFTYYFTNQRGGVVYASGFNEEGQLVTPAGLTNLATGDTISVENIGTPVINIPPVDFHDVTLTGTTTILGPTQSTDNIDAASYSVGGTPGIDYTYVDANNAAGNLSLVFTKGLLTAVILSTTYTFVINTAAAVPGNRTFNLRSSGTTFYDVDWGDGSSQTSQTSNTLQHVYATAGTYTVKVSTNSGNIYRVYNNNSSDGNQIIQVTGSSSSFNFGTNLEGAWLGCTKITGFGVINTTSVTSFRKTWQFCSSLTSFPALDASSVTNFTDAWHTCSSLSSFPLLNTSAGVNFTGAWRNCSSLSSFPAINTASGTSFDYTWKGCTSLAGFPLIDTSSGQSFVQTWDSCTSMSSFPALDTSSGTNFTETWFRCLSLTSFPLIDTSSGTTFVSTWFDCRNLTSFPAINTSSATTLVQAWMNCYSLTSFPLINTASVVDFEAAWNNCYALTSFPVINTAAGRDFFATWQSCQSITTFPLLNTSSGITFDFAWNDMTNLTTFPALNTSSGRTFNETWQDCVNLVSFPAINTSSAIDFTRAWGGCTSLANFPANVFNSTPCTQFTDAFTEDALTVTSIQNILVSLDTSGGVNGTLGIDGGLNAGASTWTPAAIAAYNSLVAKGWTIVRNP